MRTQMAGPGTNQYKQTKTGEADRKAVSTGGSYMDKAKADTQRNYGDKPNSPGWSTTNSGNAGNTSSAYQKKSGGSTTGSGFPFGTKFNPNTGEAIPKFDPHNGKQNW